MITKRPVFGLVLTLLCIGAQVSCTGGKVSLSMDIDPATISLGESATISWHWKVSNGGYCEAREAWKGYRDAKGSEVVTPTEIGTLTYKLKCSQGMLGPEEKVASVTLTVTAPATQAARVADPKFAYVTNAFAPSVTVIDTASNQVTATIEFPAGSVPLAAAISPDLEKVLVTSLDALSSCGPNAGVFVIDARNNRIASGPIAVGCEPTEIAIAPDGRHAYVASQLGDSIAVVDIAANVVNATIPLPDGGRLAGIAVTPDGLHAFATALGQGSVVVIDTATSTVMGMPIDSGNNSSGIAVSPDGSLAYVANMNALGSVTAIDTATNTVIATTPLDNYPAAVAFTPDGARAYVTQAGINGDGEFTVSVLDTASHAVVGSPIVVGSFPTSIAITADGLQAYVGNEGSSTVSVIDIPSNTVTTTLAGMNSPRGVVARPSPDSSP